MCVFCATTEAADCGAIGLKFQNDAQNLTNHVDNFFRGTKLHAVVCVRVLISVVAIW